MTATTAEYHATDFHTRWMIRRDLDAVTAIETETGGDWSEEKFLQHLRQRNCVGMVLEENWFNRPGPRAGFMVYEVHRTEVTLLKFAVKPRANRDAAAQVLCDKLLYKLESHRRRKLDVSAVVQPEWRTGTVEAMCRGKAFPYLPVLADALEDAGCAERWLLDALRANDKTARKLYAGMRKALR